jgi:hypothetical protein
MAQIVRDASLIVLDRDRDSYCTPSWLTVMLPEVDLDPCSNSRSTVRARKTYSLERGEDGLRLPWRDAVFINPPYSDVYPWVDRLWNCYDRSEGVTSAGFLVNCDPSTKWWKVLCSVLPVRFDFDKRIQFDPPPGVTRSSNSKPQSLLCDEAFWNACDPALAKFGTLWRRA